MSRRKEVTLTGYIVPADWDSDDNVISICFATEEDEYIIEPNKISEALFDLLDEDLEVTGFLGEEEDGARHLTITGYDVLPDDSEDDIEGYDGDFDFEMVLDGSDQEEWEDRLDP